MASLERWGARGRDLIPLEVDRICLGKSGEADVVIDDGSVSRFHAALERVGAAAWCVRDLDSLNGTLVNGKRLFGAHALRDGDEIVLGRTRLVFRDRRIGSLDPATDGLAPAPALTPRERDVIVELCRPLLSGNVFTPPASVRDIAEELVVTDAAVKQHLARLFDKFGILEDEGRGSRRVRLANQALQTGAVTLADLQRVESG